MNTQLLADVFPEGNTNMPYDTDAQHIAECITLVSLYLTSAIVLKQETQQQGNTAENSNLCGTNMTDIEAFSHMSNYSRVPNMPNEDLQLLIYEANRILFLREQACAQNGRSLKLMRLKEMFCKTDFEYFALLCSLSCELDCGAARLFVQLHGKQDIHCPTIGTVYSIYSLFHLVTLEQAAALQPSQGNSVLYRDYNENAAFIQHALHLRESVTSYILSNLRVPVSLAHFVGVMPKPVVTQPMFLQDYISVIQRELLQMLTFASPRICVLSGSLGIGKKLSLALAAHKLAIDIIHIQASSINSPEVDHLRELASICALWQCVVCVETDDLAKTETLEMIKQIFAQHNLGVMVISRQARTNITATGWAMTRLDFILPSLEQRRVMWQHFLQPLKADDSITPQRMAAQYYLTAGQICSSLQKAADLARQDNTHITQQHISAAVRQTNTGRLSEIADFIPVHYTWQDLILSTAAQKQLREVCNRIHYRHKVETEWGFGAKSSYGNGVSVLLYGPPGTGKTMSAQVIAGELGLPLYRINLAQIVSKYIGETAKNLDTVFNEARDNNVILFFDEADSLFAKRTDVKTSNDRHANSESSYLLQKIEEYSGISILATNLVNNFDEAFRRRIQYMVHIQMPSVLQRENLWRGCMSPSAPVDNDIDFALLASNLEISGSIIKSATLVAAYLAAQESSPIAMKHLASAVQRELLKLGKSVPHFLQMYVDDGNAAVSNFAATED